MKNVKIDLEERFVWFIDDSRQGSDVESSSMQITLSDEFLSDYAKIAEKFFEYQNYLEHCYRKQQGLKPLSNSPFKEEEQ
jgi:hypothetical protein